MKSNNIIKAVIITTCFAIGGVAHAFVGAIAVALGQLNEDVGQVQTSFAADVKIETEEMTATARVYYKPGKVRDEMNMGDQEMVVIRNFDTNKVWMIMGQGMYMEIDAGNGNNQAPEYKLISREVIGPETVNGMETIKYKSVYESKDGKFGGFTWYTDDNIAVKGFLIHESKGEKQRVKFEFTNLKRGAQADSLFEIPPGYQKLNMGGFGGMGGMGGMGQMGGAGGYSAPPTDSQTDGAPADGGLAQDVADEIQQTATDAATDETEAAKKEGLQGIRDNVRKGIGKLFGR